VFDLGYPSYRKQALDMASSEIDWIELDVYSKHSIPIHREMSQDKIVFVTTDVFESGSRFSKQFSMILL